MTKTILKYLSLLALFYAPLFAQAVGNLKGTLSVNQGSLNYSVDILTPPGIAGVAPKLSLEYNQNGGDSHLGLGWSIGGLSSITRCGSTLAQDGKNRGVSYNYEDNYCLGGQRLIAISGTKGYNGTEYRTEIDSYSKIISYGNSGQGPAYFKVYTKSGDIYEYGNSWNSQAKLSNNTIYAWQVNKIQDKLENDNSIKFEYDNEHNIKSVKYAKGENKVLFHYKDKEIKSKRYIAGTSILQTKYLDKIDITAYNKNVRTYQLDYYPVDRYNLTKTLKLKSIQEKANGQSLKPITFKWTDSGYVYLQEKITSINSTNTFVADLNGDGISDIYELDGNGKKDAIYFGSIKGGFTKKNLTLDLHRNIAFVDLNSDGKIDIYVANKHTDQIYLNEGNGDFYLSSHIKSYGSDISKIKFSDMNNDGFVDILYEKTFGFKNGLKTLNLRLNNASINGTFENTEHRLNIPNIRRRSIIKIIDINGDGKPDIDISGQNTILRDNYSTFYINNNLDFSHSFDFKFYYFPKIKFADFNADGLPDIYLDSDSDDDKIYLNQGNEKFTEINYRERNKDITLVDFNGDGYTDILHIDGSYSTISFNTGAWSEPYSDKFQKPMMNLNVNLKLNETNFGDFNGDGMIDIYLARKSDSKIYFNNFHKEYINKITDSFSNINTVVYKPLTDKSIYKKGTYRYPYIDLTPATNVVSMVHTTSRNKTINKTSYYYKDLKASRDGRGVLGFEEVTTVDETQGRKTITKYMQGFPFTGAIKEETEFLTDGTRISKINNSYRRVKDQVIQMNLAKTIQESFNPDITVTTNYKEYDKFGNPSIVETVTEGDTQTFTKTTNNVYENDEYSWSLARLTSATVTHSGGDVGGDMVKKSSFTYYANGLLKSESIKGDKTLTKTYMYDKYGNKIKETISGTGIKTRSIITKYDANGQFIDTITKPLGMQETHTYDKSLGKLKTIMINGNANLKTTYNYDPFGKPTSTINADGTKTTYTYGLSNAAPNSHYYVKVSKTGTTPIITYHDSFDRKVRTEKRGFDGTKIYEDTYYNAKGEVYKATAPYFAGENITWITYTYDKYGRPKTSTEPSPHGGHKTTTITYNGFKTSTTNAKNQTKTTTKNALGKVIKVEEEMGTFINYQYDSVGNLRYTTDQSGSKIEMKYDSFGNKTYMNDPDMGVWSYTYNVLGELTGQKDAKGQTTSIVYDDLGRMTKKTTASEVSTWVYDTHFKGALTSESTNKGFSKVYSYDRYGKVTTATTTIDGQRYTKSFTYDTNNRIDTTTEPNNFKVKYDYNNNGELSAIKTPKGKVEDIDIERLKSLIDQSLSSINDYKEKALEYEKKGRELSSKAAYYSRIADYYKGRKEYAKRLRAYAKRYRSYAAYYQRVSARYQSNASYYQKKSDYYMAKSKRNWWGRLFYRWYANRYATYVKRSIEIAKRYAHYATIYNNAANRYDRYASYYEKTDYSNTVSYYTKKAEATANEAKLATLKAKSYYQMAESSGQAASAYQEIIADPDYTYFYKVLDKDAFGRVTSYLSGNGLINQKSYDVSGVMNYVTTGFGGSDYLRNISYTYDDLGNVKTRVDDVLGINQDFEYDALNRVTASQTGGNNIYLAPMSYSYYANGNMRSKSDIGTYTYAKGNHAVTRAGNRSFTYDPNGNMINNNGQRIAYNASNKPIEIKTKTDTINFAYDMNGQRYKKISNKSESHYVGKTYEKVRDRETTKTVEKYYIYADGKVQAIHTQPYRGRGETRYLHYDALNSVDTITNMQGIAIQRAIYKPFGEKISLDESGKKISPNSSYTNRGYTGHEHIQETTNLIHMNGRIYDNAIGRFISADPHIQAPNDTQSYNRYSYVKNNPLKYTDPSGYFFSGLKKWFGKHWKAIVTTVATVAVGVLTGGTSLILQGAAIGFTAGAVGTLVNGGSIGSAIRNGVIGGLFGAVSAGFTYGIGEAFGHGFAMLGAKALAHGAVSSFMTRARGGRWNSGFWSGFAGTMLSPVTGMAKGYYAKVASSAVVAGTVSYITGGKFANGAFSGAFRFMFNEAFSDMMARKSAFPSEKTRMESAKSADEFLGNASTATGVSGGFAASLPHPIAKAIGGGLGIVSLGLTGLKHLNAFMSGNFSGQDFTVDIILDKTQYVKNPFFESLYDETFGKIAEELGK